jgi:hypothetical protein
VLLAIVAPVVAATLWGRYAAPSAANRLPRSARIAFELAVFILASAAFFSAGESLAAAALLVATAVNCLLLTAFHQWEG